MVGGSSGAESMKVWGNSSSAEKQGLHRCKWKYWGKNVKSGVFENDPEPKGGGVFQAKFSHKLNHICSESLGSGGGSTIFTGVSLPYQVIVSLVRILYIHVYIV